MSKTYITIPRTHTYSSDADLLLLPISTLDFHERELAQQIDILSNELHSILKAKATRRTLKRNGNVAVRLLVRDKRNRVVDIIITTMSLTSALSQLKSDCIDQAGKDNLDTHIILWTADGYKLPNLQPEATKINDSLTINQIATPAVSG